MAKNKSVYEIMGSTDNIIKEDEYEVHATSTPRDQYVTPKSAATLLAENKDFKKAKLLEAVVKTTGDVLKSYGQYKSVVDKNEIEMQTFNVDLEARKAKNTFLNYKANNSAEYAAMTPDQRAVKQNEFYQSVHDLVAGYNPKIQKSWANTFSAIEFNERNNNIVPDYKRSLENKLVTLFDGSNNYTVKEDGTPVTQDEWNTNFNQGLTNVSNNMGVDFPTLNKWVMSKATQQLGANDRRLYDYVIAYGINNTKESKESGDYGKLNDAYQKYTIEIEKIRQKEKNKVASNYISTNDPDLVNTVLQSGILNDSENKKDITKNVVTLRNQAEMKAVQDFGAGSDEHNNAIFDTVKLAIDTNITFPSHETALDNLGSVLTGDLTNQSPQKIKEYLSIYQMYKQYNPAYARTLAGKNANLIEEYDVLSSYYTPTESLTKMLREPIDIPSKDLFVATDFEAGFFSFDDNFGFSKSENDYANNETQKFANRLLKRGLSEKEAKEEALAFRDKMFPVVQSLDNAGVFNVDFSFRIDAGILEDGIKNLPKDNEYGIDVTNSSAAIATLTTDTIPNFLKSFQNEMKSVDIDDPLLQRLAGISAEGDEYALDGGEYTLTKKSTASGVYYIADDSGSPIIVQSGGKDVVVEVRLEDILNYHNEKTEAEYEFTLDSLGDDKASMIAAYRRHDQKLRYYSEEARLQPTLSDEEVLLKIQQMRGQTAESRKTFKSVTTDPLANFIGSIYDWAVTTDLEMDIKGAIKDGNLPVPEAFYKRSSEYQDFSREQLIELTNYAKWNSGVLSQKAIAEGLSKKITQMSTENNFVKALAVVENNKNLPFETSGYDSKSKLWTPHKSLEGGTDTLAYGHKLTKQEVKSGIVYINNKPIVYKNGISNELAYDLLHQDITIKQEALRKNIKDFNQLPKKYQLVLTNIAFNVGSVTEQNFPKLLKAIRNNNDTLVRKEMLTSYLNDKTKKRIYLTERRDMIADSLGIR